MVSDWCQANLKTLENKGDLKQMKLGIVIRVPDYIFLYSPIYVDIA